MVFPASMIGALPCLASPLCRLPLFTSFSEAAGASVQGCGSRQAVYGLH